MALPLLFPQPRFLQAHDDSITQTGPVRYVRDAALPRQGYALDIDDSQALLRYSDSAGRRYGEATLAQLRRGDGSLPGVSIRDRPDFATRGYMLDVSRDRVPTRATLERLVERLAICRYNQFQLYIEHTFANPAHRIVWEDASPITPDDLVWLDRLCSAVGIELVANQNTFGHFGRWLAHDTYRARAECPDGFEIVDGFRLPPTVLAPTETNASFALDLVRAQLRYVTSRSVNIGCDETFELGRGVSAERASQEGLAAVYAEHLHRIVDPLIAEGCTVQFWADVARNHPDILGDLPDHTCIPVVWNYDAPDVANPSLAPEYAAVLATIGVDLDAPTDFATILEPFAHTGREFWVTPGTSTWQSLVGRLPNARANLVDAAVAGRAAGATGYLVTGWGDSGHLNPPAVSLAPIAYGGALSWCAESNRGLDLADIIDERLVDDATGTFGEVAQTVGSLDGATGVTARNASPLFQTLVRSPGNLSSGDPDPDRMPGVVETLARARDDLGRARPAVEDGRRLADELDVAIGLAQHGAMRLAAKARGERLDGTRAARELAELISRYRAAWLASSRPGGLRDSTAGLEATLARYDAQ